MFQAQVLLPLKMKPKLTESEIKSVSTPTSDKLIKLVKPWFPHLEDENNNTSSTEQSADFNEVLYMKVIFNIY